MRLIAFSLLVSAIVLPMMLLGCGDDKFNVVLDQLDRPTYEIADEVALCYQHLESDFTTYYLAFDRLCIDLLVTGKTLEELAIDTTVAEILADTDTYQAEYVELEAFVIFKDDEGILIADVNNDLTEDYLVIIEDGTEYIAALTRGSQYKFMVQILITDTVNGGLLLNEPSEVENE